MRTHCSLDLETLGTAKNALIIAIGAVAFSQTELLARFYVNVAVDSGLAHGLVVDGGALKFWLLNTTENNRKSLYEPPPRGLRDALSSFTSFYQQTNCNWIWAHANFDVTILASAYQAVYGNYVPWNHRNERDLRTLFSLAANGSYAGVARNTERHNALADAEYQALCVQEAYRILGKEMEHE